MQVAVIGTGYVGLVAGTCLAAIGHQVVCIDNDHRKIADLKKGIIPIYEPGLEQMVVENTRANRLFFSELIAEGIAHAAVILIAVPTPAGADGSADLKYVRNVIRELGSTMDSEQMIVIKSTVPVGTHLQVRAQIEAELARRGKSFTGAVISNPEFMREGSAVRDFLKPDRIVIGTDSAVAVCRMRELYRPIINRAHPLLVMDPVSAEITKYAANSMLATKISFINEIARLCEEVGGDIHQVSRGIGSDRRIGRDFLSAGLGFGGSCFPKDLNALRYTFHQQGMAARLLDAVIEINAQQRRRFMDKIKSYFHHCLTGKVIAVWGLAFKPDTDDVREAPALDLIRELVDEGAWVKTYDPQAMDEARAALDPINHRISYCNNHYEALQDADALVVATEWDCFRKSNIKKIADHLGKKVIFDGRNLFDPVFMKRQGFHYFGMGRGCYE